jgi:hypothetical protein
MFATHNDTDKWAVCVDGFFGLVETEEEAMALDRDILRGSSAPETDELCETPFGSAAVLRPGYVARFFDGSEPEGGFDRISAHDPIDIADYISKNWTRSFMRPVREDPLVFRKNSRGFFSRGRGHLGREA